MCFIQMYCFFMALYVRHLCPSIWIFSTICIGSRALNKTFDCIKCICPVFILFLCHITLYSSICVYINLHANAFYTITQCACHTILVIILVILLHCCLHWNMKNTLIVCCCCCLCLFQTRLTFYNDIIFFH